MKAYLEIEMPKSCYYCPMTNDGFYLCKATSPFKELEDDCEECKPQWCPLIPVPPHVDLIDRREAIIDANERAYDFWISDDEVNATIQFLKEQPTIIPAEEGE
jgi:hypothetical protein